MHVRLTLPSADPSVDRGNVLFLSFRSRMSDAEDLPFCTRALAAERNDLATPVLCDLIADL